MKNYADPKEEDNEEKEADDNEVQRGLTGETDDEDDVGGDLAGNAWHLKKRTAVWHARFLYVLLERCRMTCEVGWIKDFLCFFVGLQRMYGCCPG